MNDDELTLTLLRKIDALENRVEYLEAVEKNVFSQVTTDILRLTAWSEVTISGGVITVTQSLHLVDTESDDAADDLDTINGLTGGGHILIIKGVDAARVVTAKDATGNLYLAGDFAFNSVYDTLTLVRASTKWYELARSNNA